MNGTTPTPEPSSWGRIRAALSRPSGTRFVLWFAVYAAVTCFTRATFFGDTRGYALSILQFIRGEPHPLFLDFGHVLWRPTGWLVFKIIGSLTSRFVGPDLRTNIAACLFLVNWVAGLLALVVLNAALRLLCSREWPATLTTIGFLFSQSFLNFSQTGCSYITGLSLLLFALFLLILGISRSEGIWPISLAAGAAIAGAVGFWFLYILALPGALALPFFLPGKITKKRAHLALWTTIFFGFFVALIYGAVIAHLELYRVRDLSTWISGSSHGIENVRGLGRSVFGFCRSVINMGDDGLSFKRFLRRDPYNPVSIWQLSLLSFGKLLCFCFVIISMVVFSLRKPRQRKMMLGLLLGSAPVMGFALYWQGGDMERYLPMFPFLFLAASSFLCNCESPRWSLPLAMILVMGLVLANGGALLKWRSSSRKEYQLSRIAFIRPLLKTGSQIAVLDDEVSETKSDPLHTTAEDDALPFYFVVANGSSKVSHWRGDFASMAFSAWDVAGDVWVSKRLVRPRPTAHMSWVEGDDRRISWHDIYFFFLQMDMGVSVGGDDGFALVVPSSKNRDFMRHFQGLGCRTEGSDRSGCQFAVWQ